MPLEVDLLFSRLTPVLLAPFVGSFLGVVIRRLPTGRPIMWSRSACDRCATPLTAMDLVPLISFTCSFGCCRHCGSPIGGFHPAIELAATGIAVISAIGSADAAVTWAACLLGWTLLVAVWIDWGHQSLPGSLTLPLLVAGLGWALLRGYDDLAAHAIGALVGYVSCSVLMLLCQRWFGVGRLGGGGEANLLAAGGAWLGWGPLLIIMAMTLMAGLLFAYTRRPPSPIPLGLCLALGIWSMFLWRNGSLV